MPPNQTMALQEERRELLRELGSLLTLLAYEPMLPRKLVGVTRERTVLRIPRPCRVDIFTSQWRGRTMRELAANEFMLSYGSIGDRFGKLVQGWFEQVDQLRSVRTLFFSVIFNDAMYLESRFLSLAQALEAYHRALCDGQYVDPATYDKYADQLRNALDPTMPAPLKQALKARIKFGNEYSQRRRFRLLLSGLDERLRGFVTADVDKFVKVVVDTRNYLIHRDEGEKGVVAQGRDLLLLCEQTRLLIYILLLQAAGLDDPTVEKAVGASPKTARLSA